MRGTWLLAHRSQIRFWPPRSDACEPPRKARLFEQVSDDWRGWKGLALQIGVLAFGQQWDDGSERS